MHGYLGHAENYNNNETPPMEKLVLNPPFFLLEYGKLNKTIIAGEE